MSPLSLTDHYQGKRVLVTGHTGFKGSWLCEWLLALGAEVYGFALQPPTNPSLFDQLELGGRIARHHIGDVRDAQAMGEFVRETRADFVFHLAAQPLVRLSYAQPVETFSTNVMGTVHLLEAVRLAARPCTVVAVTTDKCYENREWLHAYREEDAMGGFDPYSASKGAAELVIAAYRRSFFQEASGIRLGSGRAGNVIGGGDWAADRIVPDCVRALQRGEAIAVRNKVATRPWQHVLEPLSGYLLLGTALAGNKALPFPANAYASGFNFGPGLESNQTVAALVQEVLQHWQGSWQDCSDPAAPHEAVKLNLATDKAFHLLNWQPRWNFATTVAKTMSWYHSTSQWNSPAEYRAFTAAQIREYCAG